VLDLNDFPKSPREAVKAKAYEGVGIQCIPPKSGYASKYESLFTNYIFLDHTLYVVLLDILTHPAVPIRRLPTRHGRRTSAPPIS